MSTRSTRHLPRPVLGVCGQIYVRRGYESKDHAGDPLLWPRHDKRPRLDHSTSLRIIFGAYEKIVPRPGLAYEKYPKTGVAAVYISLGQVLLPLCNGRSQTSRLGQACTEARPSPSSEMQNLASGDALLQENAAPIADPASTTTAHQPKTTPRQVPRFTLVRQAKPIPVSASVQMVMMSTEVATA